MIMIECAQCYYKFEVTNTRVLTKEQDAELEGRDIMIECPRCKGQMLFEYCKTIPQGNTEK